MIHIPFITICKIKLRDYIGSNRIVPLYKYLHHLGDKYACKYDIPELIYNDKWTDVKYLSSTNRHKYKLLYIRIVKYSSMSCLKKILNGSQHTTINSYINIVMRSNNIQLIECVLTHSDTANILCNIMITIIQCSNYDTILHFKIPIWETINHKHMCYLAKRDNTIIQIFSDLYKSKHIYELMNRKEHFRNILELYEHKIDFTHKWVIFDIVRWCDICPEYYTMILSMGYCKYVIKFLYTHYKVQDLSTYATKHNIDECEIKRICLKY